MKFTRRSFIKRVGATALVAVTAPFYIPAQNLDFGVPHQILTATEMPTKPLSYFITGDLGLSKTTARFWDNLFLNDEEIAVLSPIPEHVLPYQDYDLWS